MAKKRGTSQQRKTPAKNAPDRKPSTQTREVGALAKLEKVVTQYQGAGQGSAKPVGLAAPTSVPPSAKFDTLTFILACVIAAVLAVAGYYYLSSIQIPVSEAFSTSAVRLN
jgi:hypothetical protein